MPATRVEARTQISALVEAAAALAGIDYVLGDSKRRRPPDEDNPTAAWIRYSIRHAASAQTSLAGGSGETRYTRVGTLTIQVFSKLDDGLVEADSLAAVLQGAIEGESTTGGVLFRDVTANESSEDGSWFMTLINAGFEYDDFS